MNVEREAIFLTCMRNCRLSCAMSSSLDSSAEAFRAAARAGLRRRAVLAEGWRLLDETRPAGWPSRQLRALQPRDMPLLCRSLVLPLAPRLGAEKDWELLHAGCDRWAARACSSTAEHNGISLEMQITGMEVPRKENG